MAETIERRTAPEAAAAPRRAPAHVPAASGGVSAGLRAGALTAALLCLRSWLEGDGLWLPMKAAAALWLGPAALLGGGGTDALGLLTYLAVGAVVGGLFAVVLGRRAGTRRAFFAGLATGVLVWGLGRWLVLPAVDRTLWIRVNLSPGWWLLVALVYGACLGAVPSLRRRAAAELIEDETKQETVRTFY